MLKKTVIAIGMAVIAAGLIYTGVSFAQADDPAPQPGGFWGGMGHGQRRGEAFQVMGGIDRSAVRDAMHSTLAAGLGIPQEELDSRLAAGERPYEIAASLGFSDEEFVELHTAARDSAISKLLANGVVTEDQAEWMRSHQGGMRGGHGSCPNYAAPVSNS